MMRLAEIAACRASFAGAVQDYSAEDISRRIHDRPCIRSVESWRRRLVRYIAPAALAALEPRVRASLGCMVPFSYDRLAAGERFTRDASLSALLARLRSEPVRRVLIPGCYLGGEDVQIWLRWGVKELEGIDVYSLAETWAKVIPQLERQYGAKVRFRQASIESIPFPDAHFDLLATSAVLEHVRNLEAMVEETARVLRPGGWAWHGFGPLYYSFGADHCIASYGDKAGYDHLLLNEDEYRQRLANQEHFDRTVDPNMPFWALRDQFSFARAQEYLDLFRRHFEIEHLIVIVTPEGLRFRSSFPEQWRRLRAAGLSEADLLIKSLYVVLRKR